MKKFFSSALFLFCFIYCDAQSIDILELKNGFKKFKLNMVNSDYAKNLVLIKSLNGYSTYNYEQTYDYEIVNEYKKINNKIRLDFLASKFNTTIDEITSLNPDMVVKNNFVKKNQSILIPVKKKSKTYPIDISLFNLFEEKVNTIHLTYDESTNYLKKISLNLDEVLTPNSNSLKMLGFELKKLYTKFEEIIGVTTSPSKPSPDCYEFKSQSCLYFDDRIFDGKIIWESKSVVLLIEHKTKSKINYNNGTVSLDVGKTVSFIDKSYYTIQQQGGF